MITQYYGQDASSGYGNIAQTNLGGGTPDWFDSSAPPANVTDSAVQGEVVRYLASHLRQQHDLRSLHPVDFVFVRRQLDLLRRSEPRLLRLSRPLQQRRA